MGEGTFVGTRGNDKVAPETDDHSWGERVAALVLKVHARSTRSEEPVGRKPH